MEGGKDTGKLRVAVVVTQGPERKPSFLRKREGRVERDSASEPLYPIFFGKRHKKRLGGGPMGTRDGGDKGRQNCWRIPPGYVQIVGMRKTPERPNTPTAKKYLYLVKRRAIGPRENGRGKVCGKG